MRFLHQAKPIELQVNQPTRLFAHPKTITPLIVSGFLDPAKTKRQRRSSLGIRCPIREKPTGLSTKINHTRSPLALVHSFFSPQKQYLTAAVRMERYFAFLLDGTER